MACVLMATAAYDSEYGGGPVRFARELANELVARGHDVFVVCEDYFKRGVTFEVIDGVRVLRYESPHRRGLGVRLPWFHIQHTQDLLRRYLTGPPQVVHGHSLFQYVGALRLFRGRSRCVFTVHSPFVDEQRLVWNAQGVRGRIKRIAGLKAIRRLEEECLTESQAVTALSEFVRGLVQRDYGGRIADQIERIPGWVDAGRFRPLPPDLRESTRSALEWPQHDPVIFVLRRLEARMGLGAFLRALALVRARGYSFYVCVGGTGSQLGKLVRLRNKLGLGGVVSFAGFVPEETLPLHYGACDFSVVPSSALECFGIIALESLACGRPTLVTPVGALPEVMSRFEPAWIAGGAGEADIAALLCDQFDGRLPVHGADELRGIIQREFSFEAAVSRFERVFFGGARGTNA